ncbi:DedA family protein, partial [Bacteroides thetaiotaomicron]
MDAFIDSTIQLLIEWGLPGLFISALLAGSIVP